jgi:subtilase family serine protease
MKFRFQWLFFLTVLNLIVIMPALTQTGTPLLKIVVDENGNKQIFDMQGNEVGVHRSQENTMETEKSDEYHCKENGFPPSGFLQSIKPESDEKNLLLNMQVQSQAEPTRCVPDYVITDSEIPLTRPIEFGGSSGPPICFNILESDHPEALLHVETYKLHKTPLNPGPNLTAVATSCSFIYSNPNLTINVRVQNNGTSSCGATSYLAYYLSLNTSISYTDKYIGHDLISNLASGATEDETIIVNLSTRQGVTAGTYYVAFIIDLQNDVIEDNEYDNAWYYSSPQISAPSGPAAPNLTQRSGTGNFSYAPPNLSINASIQNYGNAAAGSSELGYYLSTNTIFSGSDYLVGTDYVSSLAVGGYSNESITVDLNTVSGLPDGTYYVGYIIDHTGQVSESCTIDNYWHWNSPTINYVQKPDLIVQDVTILDNIGPLITYNYTIKNQGTVGTTVSFVNHIYLSPNTTISTGDYFIDSWFHSSTVPAGGSYTSATLNTDVTGIVPIGSYYLGVITDGNGAIDESNENNNTGYESSPQVMIKPNLTYDPANCSYTFSDPNLEIHVRTVNNSSYNSGASRVGYYLSVNNTIGTNDYRLASDHVSDLAPGAHQDNSCSINVRTATTVPALPVGTYTYHVGFIVDYQNSVDEYNENDNSGCSPSTITFLHTDVQKDPNQSLPDDFVLRQNVPNPFNPITRIEFDLPATANVTLSVYNMNGIEMNKFVLGMLSAGTHMVEWNGRDESGIRVASGMYLYRIEAKTKGKIFVDVKKMIFMK